MGTKGITEGHEKTGTGATWQSDGLRDTDVLSSATLSNFVERGIGNGVVPITLTNYSADSGGSDRNNPILTNCCVRPNPGTGTNSMFVDAGVVCLDGAFYTVGSGSAFNINTSGYYNARFNAGGMVLPASANHECWVLVIADPELTGTNNVGLVCGTVVDTSTGVYPQMPSSHLIKQSVVLAAVRVTYASPVVIASIEDKRVFIRGGPYPLTKMIKSDGAATNPINDYGTSPTMTGGALPQAGLGTLYARDPLGHETLGTPTHIHGNGQTHLFYQADIGFGAMSGGSYQLTPVHRQSKEVVSYSGPGSVTLQFTPLPAEVDPNIHLINCLWVDGATQTTQTIAQGPHYTLSGKTLTFLNLAAVIAPPLGPGTIHVSYTHAGY